MSFDKMAIESARNIGMSYRDSVAYTSTLISRTRDLAAAYGVTAQQIAAVQDGLARATRKGSNALQCAS